MMNGQSNPVACLISKDFGRNSKVLALLEGDEFKPYGSYIEILQTALSDSS